MKYCATIYTWCKIKGDLVVDEKDKEATRRDIEKSDCRVFDVHKHHQKRRRI